MMQIFVNFSTLCYSVACRVIVLCFFQPWSSPVVTFGLNFPSQSVAGLHRPFQRLSRIKLLRECLSMLVVRAGSLLAQREPGFRIKAVDCRCNSRRARGNQGKRELCRFLF